MVENLKRCAMLLLLLCLAVLFAGCGRAGSRITDTKSEPENGLEGSAFETENMVQEAVGGFGAYTEQTKITDVINDPAFGDFGRLIFPVNDGYYSGDTLGDLRLTWYSHIDPPKTVEIANYMKSHAEAGDVIFYDIYTEEEKSEDPAKADTGLFFFKGNPGARFAVCNAGGGFAYVGAMHDSFPHALELSKKGYNAFALIYRPGAQTACEDLARAIGFIFDHAEELEVDTDCYSLWGGSAGGRMAAYLSSYGTEAFGGGNYPRAGTAVIQYTGHSDYTENDPPTYMCVGEDDGIASWRTMESRAEALKAVGIDTEFHKYPNLGHGFGLGTGTSAEGWFDDAVAFWERQALSSGTQAGSSVRLSGTVPEELEYIPDGYTSPCGHPGILEKITYQTWESFTYESHEQELTKEAWVYLPYGYSEDQKYNIMYISHGGWSNETTIMGTDANPRSFKHVIDHAIEDGKIQPLIIVLPTYNNTSGSDSGDYSLALKLTDQFHNELINDLIPAVEGRYSTYAEDTTPEGIAASRNHRGFGGFSMGSVNTWCTFRYCLDFFRYFMPMSGSYTTDGEAMAEYVRASGHKPEDFFIFSASGTDDFAYSAFKAQIMAMGNVPDGTFQFADNEADGNLSFLEREGYSHDAAACDEYTYNGLRFFWNGSSE